ncbi:MAG: zf-HC2 domain-containing protein [Thermodesulfobacteriota bacterium]
MDSGELTCRELAGFLSDYLAGELPADERERFERHLGECEDCVAYLASFEQAVRLGRAAFAADDAPLPDDVPGALVRAILAARRGR